MTDKEFINGTTIFAVISFAIVLAGIAFLSVKLAVGIALFVIIVQCLYWIFSSDSQEQHPEPGPGDAISSLGFGGPL